VERRRKPARRTQPRRVKQPTTSKPDPTASAAPHLRNIEWLIAGGGDITLGRMKPIDCAATAADQDICYAMLVRRPGETVLELLERLDQAIKLASVDLNTIDEVNAPSPARSRRP